MRFVGSNPTISAININDMEEKKVYYYSFETMRALMEAVNSHKIQKNDIIQIFHDGKDYIIVYEL